MRLIHKSDSLVKLNLRLSGNGGARDA